MYENFIRLLHLLEKEMPDTHLITGLDCHRPTNITCIWLISYDHDALKRVCGDTLRVSERIKGDMEADVYGINLKILEVDD